MAVHNLYDTHPNPVVRPRRGCGSPLLAFVVALVLPVFCCGLTLLAYLVFPPPQTDILVLGLDAREGEGLMSRTDSIMLLGINPAQLRVSVLSIPRDVFIDVPGYGSQRINTVNVLGEQEGEGRGVDLLAASLAEDFDVGVDRYVRLDFQGFVALVDAVGGLTIDVERSIVDDFYPTGDGGVETVRFDSGLQYMSGERALQYARTRYADDDYHRAARQQQVVSALMSNLANPVRWPAVINVLNRYLDTDLTLWDMLRLAPPVVLNAGRFEQLVINRDYILGTGEGVAVPDYTKVLPWVDERFE